MNKFMIVTAVALCTALRRSQRSRRLVMGASRSKSRHCQATAPLLYEREAA